MPSRAEPARSLLTHELVVCTRNRPDDLLLSLSTARVQRRPFDSIVVVDSTQEDLVGDVRAVVARFGSDVHYVHTAPGLPFQRNVGVDRSTADVVHFVDDDVEMDPGYLEALARVFEEDPTVAGASGLIANLPPRTPRLWWRLALMDSRRQGIVLPSGVNTHVVEGDLPREVMWLSGCSMSYRRDLFQHERFDESLEGYALMEDVDYSVRASRHGRLVVVPAARLVHHVSPAERWDHERRVRAGVYRRGWFVYKNLSPVSRAAFWWSVVAGAVVEALVAVATGSRWRLKIAFWRVRGAVDFARGSR